MNQELLEIKGREHGGDPTVYVKATRRGRKAKAHVADSDGEPLCRARGKRWKTLDSATAKKFYEICGECQELL